MRVEKYIAKLTKAYPERGTGRYQINIKIKCALFPTDMNLYVEPYVCKPM